MLNRAALGQGFTVHISVGLSEHTKADQTGFERAVTDAPEVRECHNVTGTVESLLRV